MKKVSKAQWLKEMGNDKPGLTVGLDLGDRYSHYCVLNQEHEVVEEGRIRSTEEAFRHHFEGGAAAYWVGVRHALTVGESFTEVTWPSGDRG